MVFEEETHPNGQRLFSARIIPFRGSWVEFTIDIHDVIYVHIDKKKKFPATALLRAFGHGTNADILKLFFATRRSTSPASSRAGRSGARSSGSLLAADVPNPENKAGDPLGRRRRRANARALERDAPRGDQVGAWCSRATLPSTSGKTSSRQRPATGRRICWRLTWPTRRPVRWWLRVVTRSTEKLRKKLLARLASSRSKCCFRPGAPSRPLIKNTLAKDPTKTETEALQQIYALLRPGDAPNLETARPAAAAAVLQPQAIRPRAGWAGTRSITGWGSAPTRTIPSSRKRTSSRSSGT